MKPKTEKQLLIYLKNKCKLPDDMINEQKEENGQINYKNVLRKLNMDLHKSISNIMLFNSLRDVCAQTKSDDTEQMKQINKWQKQITENANWVKKINDEL